MSDLVFALVAALAGRPRGSERRALGNWAGGAEGLACLSVRSAFDLLLESLELAPGDEVLMSAITHPDMVRIVEAHDLRPIPVDIDCDTLACRIDVLERALTPKTRLLVVAHLFGGRMSLAPLADVTRREGLLLVEDCAQAFRGPADAGDALADVSLFSFGTIKTATALGGALVRVADPELRARMRALQARRPAQSRLDYARRVLKAMALTVLARPRAYALFARTLDAVGADLDHVVGGAVRGFPGPDLIRRIRRRPSAPNLALLERRLARFDAGRLEQRARFGDRAAAALPSGVAHPGSAALEPTHWVFPILATARASLIARLRQAGFDAGTATSGIGVVQPPPDRPDLAPSGATRLLGEIVFLPVYPALGRDLDRLLSTIAAWQPPTP